MRKIDWNEILTFYNSVFKTNHTSVSKMLEEGYKNFKGLKEFSLKLDVRPETLRLKLIKSNIKINKVGKKKRI